MEESLEDSKVLLFLLHLFFFSSSPLVEVLVETAKTAIPLSERQMSKSEGYLSIAVNRSSMVSQ